MNGIVQRLDGNTLHISVSQSYGNCPKYIQACSMTAVHTSMHACMWARLMQARAAPQARHLDVQPAAEQQATPEPLTGGAELGERQQAFIRQADTFFLGTCYEGEEAASYVGCDVSHRGGPPGFVRVASASSLIWPDYVGNWFFMSLGAWSTLEVGPY